MIDKISIRKILLVDRSFMLFDIKESQFHVLLTKIGLLKKDEYIRIEIAIRKNKNEVVHHLWLWPK